MPVQALSQIDPQQFFRPPSTDGAAPQRLNTQVSGVAVSNDLSGRLSVTTAEGDTITLTADLEYDYRAVNYASQSTANGSTVDLKAASTESALKKEFGVTVEGDLNEQELNDLEKLFSKVSNIFKSFFRGNDEAGLVKTANLAERLGQLPSLSGFDLSVDVQRSVTVLAAQIASAVTDRQPLPAAQGSPTPVTTSSASTPSEAPAAETAIVSPPTNGAAPASASTASPATDVTDGVRVSASAQEGQPTASLVQQVLGALKVTMVESRHIRKHLPDFFEKLREDLTKELRADREQKSAPRDESTNWLKTPATTSASVVFAYQSIHQTSVALSIHG